ncbi:KPN_02809 family neutral zinc metallopeptidase [Daejeonella oryzae]|uniref:KPN_02809 family neutral zinc metallopeptidase n=1 Tax=Daejeonella oryzae TaxID=1122943 RepID=UPI00041CFFCB|nr:neutral zinc metallopeptidase [Daejeonella oryzae]
MRWLGRRGSGNIEDRRSGGGKVALGGGALVVAIILGLITGKNPLEMLDMVQSGGAPQEQTTPTSAPTDEEGKFVDVVLADTEEVWGAIFKENGSTYQEPNLVLFRGSVASACGSASAATGPFYCPTDQKVYIDLSFKDDLTKRFGAGGDFPMAYVIAHEVGHHIQNLMGTSDKVQAMRGQVSETEYNRLSVKLELQADFYAGVWANHAQKMFNSIEDGDIQEALTAAAAIGDDRLQKQSQGEIVPDAFTHGTSEQRMRWFKKGYETGDINQGDTFNASSL